MPSRKNVPLSKVENIEFGKKKFTKKPSSDVPLTDVEISNILKESIDLYNTAPVLATLTEPFSNKFKTNSVVATVDTIISEADEIASRKLNYASLFNENNLEYSLDELIEIGKNINLDLTEEDHLLISRITIISRDQWRFLRIGRITGTSFKNSVRTNLNKPALSTIKYICYSNPETMHIPAIEYGIRNEKIALAAVKKMMDTKHQFFNIENCGLIVSKKHTFIASSPDALCSCQCCGEGVIEIKCPWTLRDGSNIEMLTSKPSSYLEKKDTGLELNTTHTYYYQVQLQLYTTQRNFCFFSVWSPNDLVILKINRNDSFLIQNLVKAENFFYYVILPELLGKYFSNNSEQI